MILVKFAGLRNQSRPVGFQPRSFSPLRNLLFTAFVSISYQPAMPPASASRARINRLRGSLNGKVQWAQATWAAPTL